MAGQRDGASLGDRLDVAVAGNQRGAVQRLLDVQVDVDRVGVVADLDVVPDVAEADQPGDSQFGGGALFAIADRAGQRQVAVLRGGLHAVRHRDVQRQRVVGRGGQHRVVAEVFIGQHDLQVVVHVLHAADALRGRGGLQVLRVTRHGAVQRDVPAGVYDMDIRIVDERIVLELRVDRVADVFGDTHSCVPPERVRLRICRLPRV